MFSLGQVLRILTQPLGISHSRIDLHMCPRGQGQNRPFVLFKSGFRNQQYRTRRFPRACGRSLTAPQREGRIGGIIEDVDVAFLGWAAFFRGDYLQKLAKPE